jgi:hypothetical protein
MRYRRWGIIYRITTHKDEFKLSWGGGEGGKTGDRRHGIQSYNVLVIGPFFLFSYNFSPQFNMEHLHSGKDPSDLGTIGCCYLKAKVHS